MPNDKFKYGKATITIRAKRGSDELDSPWLLRDLLEVAAGQQKISNIKDLHDSVWGKIGWFVDILLCSEVKGDLGFPWPNYLEATTEELFAAYECLMLGDSKLVKSWRDVRQRANLDIASPED